VLPGSQSLADADALSASNRQRAATLRQQLNGELAGFDFIFLDCPPSLGQLTRAALGASAEIFIPIQCEYFAMEGLSQIIELARQTKARDNHRLEIGGIVLTMYDPELDLANEVADEVRGYFDDTVFQTPIPRDVHISEAPSHGLSVLDYAPRARGAWAYSELVMEVIERE
jgi:chromosome partitioning protein